MNPTVEAAWIAAGSGLLGVLVGVGGTVTVAIFASRNTRKATADTLRESRFQIIAQLEADRRSRIWEKQAAVYTELISGTIHRNKERYEQWHSAQGLKLRLKPSPSPVNWQELEGRLTAYASPAVISAFQEAAEADNAYESAYLTWILADDNEKTHGQGEPPTPPREIARISVQQAFDEAKRLENRLTDIIRDELHASITGEA